MAKIFYHHIDDDGKCAAAIAKRELVTVFDQVSQSDFIGYNHDGVIETPEFKENEKVFIVDLSISDVLIEKVLKPALEVGCKVVWIDHHKTSRDFIDYMSDEHKELFSKITHFIRMGLSATMLTWVYALMHEDEREDPNKVVFDFTAGYTHVAFDPGTKQMREYNIPDVIRYIDDNDVWRHEIEQTKYFNLGFQTAESKHPMEKIWDNLIYAANQRDTAEYVSKGITIWTYQENINKNIMRNAFDTDLFGPVCLCVNNTVGNSRIFGERYHEYPMVCKFGYDGSISKWRYTLYSSNRHPGTVDVSKVAEKYGGGGHPGAAGFVLDENIFDKNNKK